MANAASGMAVSDECTKRFTELKTKKSLRFIVFKIDEKAQQITVEKFGGPDATYEEFASALPESDCRYGVYDFDYTNKDNCQMSKIFSSRDTSRVKAKMMYASSKEGFRRALNGVQVDLQATDPTEMDMEVIKERVK